MEMAATARAEEEEQEVVKRAVSCRHWRNFHGLLCMAERTELCPLERAACKVCV